MQSTSTNQFSTTSKEPEIDVSLSDISLENTIDFNISDDCDIQKYNNDRDTLVNDVLGLCLRHNLTKAAVEDIAKLINKVPGATIEIPSTKYLLFKECHHKSPIKMNKYIYCIKCEDFTKFDYLSKDFRCESCQMNLKQSKTTFLYLSISQQLSKIISDNFNEIIN